MNSIPIYFGLLLFSAESLAQLEFSYEKDIKIFDKNGDELTLALAGGLNSGQYSTIDLDLDSRADLVIFDRSADKISTYINTGSSYEYAPEYEYRFPSGLRHWVLLADYNCDGKKDIFTYSNLGMRVFANTSATSLTWAEPQPLYTQGSSSEINLAMNASDIPAIADLDDDGDLDILVYHFAAGAHIQHHKNMSIENNGDCSELAFVRVSRAYGDFEECSCDKFVFDGGDCLSGGRQLHAGGKSILAYDRDGDGDMDLVIGQEECTDLSFLENKGNPNHALFDAFTHDFPEADKSIYFPLFPAPYYEDLNFDGEKDIILAPNLRSNADASVDYAHSSWLYSNQGGNNFSFVKKNFLQDEMIDIGEYAYPAFVDSDDDLLIGNRGANISGQFKAALQLYTQTPEGFSLSDEDYAGLSQLNFTHINPSFTDMNDDGREDLIIKAIDSDKAPGLYYILNSGGSMKYDTRALVKIDVKLNASDDALLVDVNNDDRLDLLVGKANGQLAYYSNSGTNLHPTFNLEDESYLGLDFSRSNSSLNITAFDIDHDNRLDLITTDGSGRLTIYSDLSNADATANAQLLQLPGESAKRATQFGRISHPAVGRSGSKIILAIGSICGGVNLLSSEGDSRGSRSDLSLTVYPNPGTGSKLVKFFTPNDRAELELFGVSGQKLAGKLKLSADRVMEIDLSAYGSGLCLARITGDGRSKTVKFVLGSAL